MLLQVPDKAGDVKGFEKHLTKLSAPTQRRERLAVRPFVLAYIDDDAVETPPLSFVDGDGEYMYEGQLGPYAPTTTAACGQIVVCSLDGSNGDDVTKVNDLTSRPHSLKRLFEVLRSSVIFHADEDSVRHLGRRPGGATFVHPSLYVDDVPNGSIGNAVLGPNVVVDDC